MMVLVHISLGKNGSKHCFLIRMAIKAGFIFTDGHDCTKGLLSLDILQGDRLVTFPLLLSEESLMVSFFAPCKTLIYDSGNNNSSTTLHHYKCCTVFFNGSHLEVFVFNNNGLEICLASKSLDIFICMVGTNQPTLI